MPPFHLAPLLVVFPVASAATPLSSATTETSTVPLSTPISSMSAPDLVRAERRLLRHVAYIQAREDEAQSAPLTPRIVDGWAAVVGARKLVCQAFLVHRLSDIRVQGPKGTLPGSVRWVDLERRVAEIETTGDLELIGLVPVVESPPDERSVGMMLFSLVTAEVGAGVVSGALTELGDAPHLEGNLRSELELERGMPVFDARLRWVGLARAVAWDRDRAMLIPSELTKPKVEEPAVLPPASKPERPWWAR